MKPLATLFFVSILCARLASADELPAKLRHPVAAARLDRDTLVVANQRSGTLSLVDLPDRTVAEHAVGGQPIAIAVARDGLILVADAERHILHTWKRASSSELQPLSQVSVGKHPTCLQIASDGQRAYVGSLWSRKVDVVSIEGEGKLAVKQSFDTAFPVRRMLLLPGERHLLVTDAFSGGLQIFDLERGTSVTRQLQGHNIYGLAWDEANDRLLMAHQILNSELPVDVDNIQWGALLKNVVRVISRKQLFDTSVNLTTATRVISLGQEGDGSADPTAVALLADGGFAVTLGGSHELVVVESTGLVTRRVAVGQRPMALVPISDSELVIVNSFDNSLSFVNTDRGEVTNTLALGPLPKLSAADRGERLFYDARLSFDKWISCHSCHTEGHTHGLRADTLGDGSFGAPKRTLTLLGTRDTDRWAWNGEVKELHEQVRKSIETSMQGHASGQDVYDLTAFLHTLSPPPPRQPATTDKADQQLLAHGRTVFAQQRCTTCHIPPLTFTSHDVYDVGLADERGQAKFNPPSLRGVGQASKLLHDGRATSLEDVFDVYGHQIQGELSQPDRKALLRFLRSL